MILSTQDINQRLQSPLNLVNQLKSRQPDSMQLFTGPSSADLIDDIDKKIKTSNVKNLAIDVMHESLNLLKANVNSFEKIRDLAAVADTMNKIIGDGGNSGQKGGSQIVIYKPVMQEINHYDTVNVYEE